MPGQADLAQKSARAISGAAHGNATSQSSNLGNLLNARSSVAALKATAAQLTAPAPTNLTGLPDRLKMGVEALSGLAMDDVRVHRNSALPAQMQAHAFAQGTDIHLAPGQERHLPHEAWHVVQNGRVPIQAGMPAQVLVTLHRRTMLAYLFEPVLQAFWLTGHEH